MNSVDSQTLSFFNRLQRIALVVGVVGAVLVVAGGFLVGFNQFFQSYLVSFLDWIGLSLGSLAILMLHFVGGGRWAGSIRRILEAGSKTIWLMALLFIPILAGLGVLYPWMDPAAVAADPILQYRTFYNNLPFFLLRVVILFAIWLLLTFLLSRWSAQEEAGDLNARRREARLSAPGLILFFITVTIAAFDWILSIFPNWSSSVFGLLLGATQGLAAMAFAMFILPSMPGFRAGEVGDARDFKRQLFRDIGALELTMVVLWAYMSYFQFLIIWAGNIPHELTYYLVRSQNGWLPVTVLIALVLFVLPFLALIPMRVRSSISLLSLIGLIILVINYIYYYWIVIPAYYPAFHLSWMDIVMPIAMGGLWLAVFTFHLKRRSLQPYWDMPMEPERAQEVQE